MPRAALITTMHPAEHQAWMRMRRRCCNPHDPSFPAYGGRGITVCERWSTFAAFLADMGPRPSPKHSLDRWPDNDGPYAPENCRWATHTEQMRNRRCNIVVEIGGRSMTVAEAATHSKVEVVTVYDRIARGWDPVRAVTAPRYSRVISKDPRNSGN